MVNFLTFSYNQNLKASIWLGTNPLSVTFPTRPIDLLFLLSPRRISFKTFHEIRSNTSLYNTLLSYTLHCTSCFFSFIYCSNNDCFFILSFWHYRRLSSHCFISQYIFFLTVICPSSRKYNIAATVSEGSVGQLVTQRSRVRIPLRCDFLSYAIKFHAQIKNAKTNYSHQKNSSDIKIT